MRNGSEIWIPIEKAEQLQNALIKGDRGFVKLTDAEDRIINMVDISEFLSPEQMNDRARTKAGEWQCDRKNWHLKKNKCNCAFEAARSHRTLMEASIKRKENEPLTPEDQARGQAAINRIRQELVKRFGERFAKK